MIDEKLIQTTDFRGLTCEEDLTPHFADSPKSNKNVHRKKGLSVLPRNLLVILYDGFETNEEHPSYLKRRGIVYFQTFFFQQFPNADIGFSKKMLGLLNRNCSHVFWRKDNREHSVKAEEHALYLPLVKQASLLESKERHSVVTQMQRQESFGMAFEVARDYKRGSTVTTAISDQVLSPDLPSQDFRPTGISYLIMQFNKWRDMHRTAIENKRNFLQSHENQFYNAFIQNANDFAREIFLDPTQCENPRFALPQLMRENFYQKGLFYRTEKILVHSYSNCFQHFSVDYTRSLLFETQQAMQTKISQNQNARGVLRSLLAEPIQIQIQSDVLSFQNDFSGYVPPLKKEESNDGDRPMDSLSSLYSSKPLFPQFANQSHERLQEEELPKLGNSNYNEKNCLAFACNLGDAQIDLEDDEALLAGLEIPTMSLLKPSMFNIKTEVQEAIMKEDIDIQLPEPMPTLQPLGLSKPFTLDFSKLQFAPPMLNPSQGSIIPPMQQNFAPMTFEMVGFNSNKGIFTQSEELTPLYRDVAAYQLRQYVLICEAHCSQLTYLLDQISLAPSLNKNYFLFLEDYVEKERNLRYLLKKVSQNFIMQEAFQETMLRSNVYQAKETQKQTYLCDFLLLEFLDSIWINEVYRRQRENLANLVRQEVHSIHTMERFEELATKRSIFRKVINAIHQTEYSLESNQEFLTISLEVSKSKEEEQLKLTRGKSESQNRPSLLSNISQFGCSTAATREDYQLHQETVALVKIYDELVGHIKASVKRLLSQMQKKSNTVQEYMEYCSRYEEFEFQKLQEVEHDYILLKKHYLGKAFAKEFAIKLDNNKIIKPPTSELFAVSSGTSSCSTASSILSGGSYKQSPTTKSGSVYQNMSLNQILYPELVDSFFHNIVRRLLKNEDLKSFMDTESFMQSLFMLFHIEQASRSDFASDINKYLISCHSDLQDLYAAQPELLTIPTSPNEEEKNAESNSMGQGVSIGNMKSNESSAQDSQFGAGAFGGHPFSPVIGIGSEEDDDELLMNCCQKEQPSLSRAYSAQKRQVYKGLSTVIFREFLALEKDFDFKKYIEAQRELERKRALDLIQQRIDSFNMQIQAFNAQNQQQQPVQQATILNQSDAGQVPARQPAAISENQQMEDDTLDGGDEVFSNISQPQSFPKLIRGGGGQDQDEEIKMETTMPFSIPFTGLAPTLQRSSSSQQPQYQLLSGKFQKRVDGIYQEGQEDASDFPLPPVALQAYQSLQPEKGHARGFIQKLPDLQSSMS